MREYSYGPIIFEDGVEFRLWAPLKDSVFLKLKDVDPIPMKRDEEGWHRCRTSAAGPGSLYSFVLPEGSEVPDPGSRHQPEDVRGPSEVVDLTHFQWKADKWIGRPWEESVIYELHVGSFTPQGTFRAAMDKLDHLARLGITAIQIMPISDFPGAYNWGYDGVLPYAPDSSYGRPEDFMALVDAAHERGLSIFLDVVYNHFGPDGNYLPNYAPLFTDRHTTPWGDGINYDGSQSRPIREFVIQNAVYWIKEFRLDGLRLDAVHAINDDSDEHVLVELARHVRDAAGNRHVHLIVENEDNDSDLLKRDEEGRAVRFTAQWNDDVHHVLHVAATDETFGYYQDYADDAKKMGRALAEGFVFQGDHMRYRGETRGKPTGDLPPTAFISFIQNHDQIGNRAHGDRMITYRPLAPLKAVTSIYLLSPQIPMLFMGEEWGARENFPYFCDFNDDLNEKVRTGRRKELSRLPGFDADDLLDPTARTTFEAAKLDWSKLSDTDASEMLHFYRSLLALRHERIVPMIEHVGSGAGKFCQEDAVTAVKWRSRDGAELHLLANLSNKPAKVLAPPIGETIYSLGDISGNILGTWAVAFSVSSARR